MGREEASFSSRQGYQDRSFPAKIGLIFGLGCYWAAFRDKRSGFLGWFWVGSRSTTRLATLTPELSRLSVLDQPPYGNLEDPGSEICRDRASLFPLLFHITTTISLHWVLQVIWLQCSS
ncbi:hypothetical protein Pmani_031088 [Petrolisthes manimaculis]|uniref:Uncharacterized protein n=1 Tax=Petrolisthes manimaculis TaxID=1843537 RepID=A0AAE1TSV2_9EUCA|nr:hypothetical protein Pmani_031088 [Petrolisthes manimaculis]